MKALSAAEISELMTHPGEAEAISAGTGQNWVVYGAGNHGRHARHILEAAGEKVTAFLDRSAQPGSEVEGLPCWNPGKLEPGGLSDFQVCLAIFNPKAALTPIFAILEPAQPARLVPFLEFHALHSGEFGEVFWLTDRSYYAAHVEEALAAYELLEDERSREIFCAALKMRLRGEWRELEAAYEPSQYFAEGIPSPAELHLVDCGAFEGEVPELALATGHRVLSYRGFEPDSANYARLAKSLKANLPAESASSIWPSGVWSSTCVLRFSSGQGSSSHIGEEGDVVVPVVALDDAIPSGPVNFIKMDIESAESAAIEGARGIITEQTPHLRVCVYHRPADLWAILLQIHFLNPGYRFYLRTHEYNGFELVLYAVPR